MHAHDTLRLLRSSLRTVRQSLPAQSTMKGNWKRAVVDGFRENREGQEKGGLHLRSLARDFEFYLANSYEHQRLLDLYEIGKEEKSMRQKITQMSAHVGLQPPDFPQLENMTSAEFVERRLARSSNKGPPTEGDGSSTGKSKP